MSDEKEAFLRRMDNNSGEFGRVMNDVVLNDATYVVKTTNTVQNSRSPESFRPVAVILPYERYKETGSTGDPVETLRRIADQDIGGNAPWLADELHTFADRLAAEMHGERHPAPDAP